MVDGFVDTQKNFLSDLEDKYIPKQHKSAFEEKKKEFLSLAKKYTQKGKELLAEISEDERVSEGKDKLEKWLLKAKLHGENTANTVKEKVKKHSKK